MKKLFTIVAAFAATMSVNATVVNLDHSALNADAATAVSASTILATADEFEVATPYDDNMKAVTIKHEGYFDFQLNGVACSIDTTGVQGANNPMDADGNNPANACTVPASGSFLKINATVDGYLYVFHKASSNKQYIVFENDIPVGYEFGMVIVPEAGATVLNYAVVGNNEYNQITDSRKIDWVERQSGYTTEDTQIKKNGLGAFRFACFAGCEYKVMATGSKISAAAVAYTAEKEAVSVVGENGAIVILPINGVAVENINATAAAVKVVENGQLMIIKNGVRFNALGAIVK